MPTPSEQLRALPSVDELLQDHTLRDLEQRADEEEERGDDEDREVRVPVPVPEEEPRRVHAQREHGAPVERIVAQRVDADQQHVPYDRGRFCRPYVGPKVCKIQLSDCIA